MSIAYAGDTWDSHGTKCLTGAYDDGTRAIDCTYICSSEEVESDVKKLVRKSIDLDRGWFASDRRGDSTGLKG